MNIIDPSMLVVIVVALFVLILFISLFRKNTDKFEFLANERKDEIVRLTDEIAELRGKLECGVRERQDLTNVISRLEAEIKAERHASEEKIQILFEVRQDMEKKFKELASDALRLQGEQLSKSNIEQLQATLTPLREHVGHFEQALQAAHKDTITDRATLKTVIQQLSQSTKEISQDAVALTRALKGDQQKQGAWGEMVLESILERSGLREGEEYEVQVHRRGESGELLRPDVVVNIPGGKTLVIDSKVSLVDYTDVINADVEEDILNARKRHVASLKGHIKRLAAKDYQNAEKSTVDYVILFVPIEGALSEALREDGHLTEFAIERNIAIATPTTLMMALKTVAHVWNVERRNRNAEAIANRAGLLYDKIEGFVRNMEILGRSLDKARDSYHEAFAQLSSGRGNLLSQAKKLKDLGARTGKSIDTDFDDAHDDQDDVVARIEACDHKG